VIKERLALTKQIKSIELIEENGKRYKQCPDCECKLKINNFDKHMELQHQKLICDGNQFVKCPECDKNVKSKNIKKHLNRIHGGKAINTELTVKDIRELKKIRTADSFYQNKEVAAYLSKNPKKEHIGKFGVPQDKYRWGYFGSSTMEYDSWSRNSNKKA
jgi:uncharacterized C2H2 Zn-finger protein